MADYLTTDTELTSVANAIRTKGGTSASLVYPTGFVSAINAIPSGGGTDVSDTTATAADVRTGKYFYTSAGVKTQGTIQNQAAQTITPGATDQTIASGKYLSGTQTIKGDANLIAENIAKDVTIFGVTGTHEGGGGGNPVAEENDVIFIDYDGTIRYSYSASEFANMTALPANPTHDGLTAQGWNWTLSDAKTYVANCGGLVIGQMYTTNDGKTKLFMDLDAGDQRSVEIRWSQTVSRGVSIDWGDGSSLSTVSGTGLVYTSHTYASNGSYIISIDCTSGKCVLGANKSSRCILGSTSSSDYYKMLRLKKVYIGNNVDGINSYAFQYCRRLSAIAIPKTVTSISGNALYHCNNIPSITIPSEIQTINQYLVTNSSIKFVSLPNSITTFSNMLFTVCPGIKRIHIGNNCTSIGDSSLYDMPGCSMMTIGSCTTTGMNFCRNMTGLTKLSLPATLTTIGSNAFAGNSTIMEYHFKSTTPPSIGTGAFTSINSDCKIYVPAASLSAYQNASNWSNYASYMAGE